MKLLVILSETYLKQNFPSPSLPLGEGGAQLCNDIALNDMKETIELSFRGFVFIERWVVFNLPFPSQTEWVGSIPN